MFQFNIVLGILIAYFSNYLLQDVGEGAWRWMLGVEGIPALIFVGLVLLVPKSPRWLVVKKGAIEEARAVLQQVNPATVERELQAIINSKESDLRQVDKSYLFSKKYRWPVMLAVVFAIFNQVSGINAIIYFAPRIFEMAGLGRESALLSSVGIGLVNLIFTMIALRLIDNFGRRKLMLIGSIGLIITLALVARFFESINSGPVTQPNDGTMVAIYLFIYIAFFALSQGAVIWVFISEIFPNKVRASGMALGSFTHWIMAAFIAQVFLRVVSSVGIDNTFWIFTGMMVLQLLFVWKIMPETKGVSLEELGQESKKASVSS
jgi:SP family arabinose:H+ symporter-like MFS transporter